MDGLQAKSAQIVNWLIYKMVPGRFMFIQIITRNHIELLSKRIER